MKIFNVLYVDIFGDWIGGGQRSLMDLAKSLDPERFNPVIVCPEEGKFVDLIRSHSIAVEIVPMGTFKTVNFISWVSTFNKLAGLVKNRKIDLIHVNGLRAAIYCGAVAKYFKIPLVWHVRVPESGGVAEKAAYAFAHKIIVNSRAVGKKFANWRGSSDKVTVIYNGINLEEFKPGERKNKSVAEFGFGENDPLVGIVGELSPKKGQKYFLEAASKVFRESPQVKFLIVGEEHDSGVYKGELIRLADRLKISSSVYFLGFRDDIAGILDSLALLVHCPEREGFGRVVVEAMALKVPVVATNAGGIPEIIKDGVNGFLIPVGDPETLAKTILDILRDKARSGILGEAGRKTVEESFDLKRQIKKIEGIYRELLQGHEIGAIKQYADLFLDSLWGDRNVFAIQPEHRRQLDEFADYLAGGSINFRSTDDFLKDRNNFLIENFLTFLMSKKILKGSRLYRDLETIKRQIREKAVTGKDYDERISIQTPESLIGEYYDPGDPERKKRLEIILQNLNASAGEKILDLGCGAGALVYHSALAGAAAWGVDYSNKSIEAAVLLSSRYNFKDKATFLVRDVTNGALPFDDGFFDKVVAADFIEHITHFDKEKLIKEVRRVLKTGGTLIIYTPNGIRELFGHLKRRLLRAFRTENYLNDNTRLHFGLIDRFRFEGLLRGNNLIFKRYHVDITRPYLATTPLLNDLLSANFLWVIKKSGKL
ncbi:MAG: glycosyltransferase [Candidatus Omnitrophota bacterium]